MFDAVFFLLNAQIFLIAVVPLTKICSLSVSPDRSEQAFSRCRYHIPLSLSPSYMQSNGDFFSVKIEQLSVLIHNANRQIHNAPMIGR